jgi:hypothetical protein
VGQVENATAGLGPNHEDISPAKRSQSGRHAVRMKKLSTFDLDGTLAEPKQPIDAEMGG